MNAKFSETQIVGILKDADSGIPVADLRQHGVRRATFLEWRSKYGGAMVADVKRLRELQAENSKLKRMYADLAVEHDPSVGYAPCSVRPRGRPFGRAKRAASRTAP